MDEAAEEAEAEVKTEELDLSDLEQMLDMEDEAEVAEEMPEDLDFDLDLEPAMDEAPGAAEDEVEIEVDELDISDLEETLLMEDEPELEDATIEAPEDMEFEIEDVDEGDFDGDMAAVEEIGGATKTMDFTATYKMDAPTVRYEPGDLPGADVDTEERMAPKKKLKPVRKKRSSKSLIALFVLLALVAGVYFSIPKLTDMGITIPYVSDFLKPEVQDTLGNLKIETVAVKGQFVENSKSGDIFVITGKVRNDYPDIRSSIRVTGKLFAKGKQLIKTKTVYSGNILSDLELSGRGLDVLDRFGSKRSTEKVQPGKDLPFMIIFAKVPDNLEEFTVEVAGSSAL